jgi:hypothetical protein
VERLTQCLSSSNIAVTAEVAGKQAKGWLVTPAAARYWVCDV